LIEYCEESPDGWARRVTESWSIEETPTGVRIWGDCPTCWHRSTTQVDKTVGVKGSGRAAGDPLPVAVICDCTEPHSGRPDGVNGCGRGGYIDVFLEDPR
jgi:hypothetical protein